MHSLKKMMMTMTMTKMMILMLFSMCLMPQLVSCWRLGDSRWKVRLEHTCLRCTAVVAPTSSTVRAPDSGAAMQIEKVNLSIGNNDIISDINWTIMPKERWALVGKNGAGKSTLLKALTGSGGENVMVRDGSISIARKARVGYLEQKGVSGSTKSVRGEVASRMDRLQAATKALEAAEAAVASGDTSDDALSKLEVANTEFELAGGYTVEQKVSNILRGLGFAEEDYDRLCSEFSGGWQMRIALARLLLSEPDLLFLDEPSNHLDKAARDWLGTYLSAYDGTLLIVSHDTELLDVAANSIAEVRAGKIELYKSRSHGQWLVERDERVKMAQIQYEANQREIDRLQGFVDRFGAKTMGASMAQSRLKTIEKLSANGPEAPIVSDGPTPVLRLPPPPRGSAKLLELKDVKLAWPAAKADATSPFIIRDCSLRIERGMRIAVRGPNGAGKSTLLSAMSGKLMPSLGVREEGDDLALGVFTQDLAQDLPQDMRAVDVVTSAVRLHDPTLSDERARSVLGALGLTGEKSLRLVGHLSGGEKARVALARFVLIPHNLLLLDEPSNHLDVATIEVLTGALREFTGSILVISHDKPFLEALEPTHVITVKDGVVSMEARSLRSDDWVVSLSSSRDNGCEDGGVESKFANSSSGVKSPTRRADSATAADNDTDRKKVLNAPKKVKKVEAAIEKCESEMKEIDALMFENGRNREKLTELQKRKDDLQPKLDKLFREYDELLTHIN